MANKYLCPVCKSDVIIKDEPLCLAESTDDGLEMVLPVVTVTCQKKKHVFYVPTADYQHYYKK